MTDPTEQPPQLIVVGSDGPSPEEASKEVVEQPAKVMRIGSMVKQLLDEVRTAPLDEAGRRPAARDLRQSIARAGRRSVAGPA